MLRRQQPGRLLYSDVGVKSTRVDVDAAPEPDELGSLLSAVRKTFAFRNGVGRPLLPLGYFANVLQMGAGVGLAISTDGVGTKLLIAQLMDRYDTVGIDCVAMNVNDIMCVGAEPIAMTDYIAIERADPALLAEIGKGLLRGAELSGISIPGGEIAQVADMLHGARAGRGFDLIGTCVGVVALDRLLIGRDIQEGDVVVGLASSGIHSNGLTLARRVLLDGERMPLTAHIPEFGRTVGEELLEPTTIYVPFALACLEAGLPIRAFIHVTSDGFMNLTRVEAAVGFVIDDLLDIPPIFQTIQRAGAIPDEEMFRVFNMGVGFCAIVPPEAGDDVLALARRTGCAAKVIGKVVADADRTVRVPARRLEGRGDTFHRY